MTRYVVGFYFSPLLDQVLLIRKARPDWQKGKLNGIGGHIRDGETEFDAMQREFKEEANISTNQAHWVLFAKLTKREHWALNCFCMQANSWPPELHTYNEESTEIVNLTDSKNPNLLTLSHCIRSKQIVRNLEWLIPMALDKEICYSQVEVYYI